jgi:peptide chain release factor
MEHLDKHLQKELELRKKMRQLKIYHKDIREQFIKSSGKGGQNVNKVSTCVMLLHVPTGIQVKCQEHRTQAANRYQAKRILVDKVHQQQHDQKVHQIQAFEKRRRQTRKRPGILKEEILQKKHQVSEKKAQRRKIIEINVDEVAS